MSALVPSPPYGFMPVSRAYQPLSSRVWCIVWVEREAELLPPLPFGALCWPSWHPTWRGVSCQSSAVLPVTFQVIILEHWFIWDTLKTTPKPAFNIVIRAKSWPAEREAHIHYHRELVVLATSVLWGKHLQKKRKCCLSEFNHLPWKSLLLFAAYRSSEHCLFYIKLKSLSTSYAL